MPASMGPEIPFCSFSCKYTSEYPKPWRKLIKSRNWKGLAKAWADYNPSAKGEYVDSEHKQSASVSAHSSIYLQP